PILLIENATASLLPDDASASGFLKRGGKDFGSAGRNFINQNDDFTFVNLVGFVGNYLLRLPASSLENTETCFRREKQAADVKLDIGLPAAVIAQIYNQSRCIHQFCQLCLEALVNRRFPAIERD